jgi:hypothetical protein
MSLIGNSHPQNEKSFRARLTLLRPSPSHLVGTRVILAVGIETRVRFSKNDQDSQDSK